MGILQKRLAEEWLDIPGFPGYQASNQGRIKAIEKRSYSPRGRGYTCVRKERLLRGRTDRNGYVSHTIKSRSEPNKKLFLAHRLVAIAFIRNAEGKSFIKHKNGIKTDNRPANLEWCTRSENGIHAVSIGLHTALRGEINGNSRLLPGQVETIRRLYRSGSRQTAL